jgi:hypothetical protein
MVCPANTVIVCTVTVVYTQSSPYTHSRRCAIERLAADGNVLDRQRRSRRGRTDGVIVGATEAKGEEHEAEVDYVVAHADADTERWPHRKRPSHRGMELTLTAASRIHAALDAS